MSLPRFLPRFPLQIEAIAPCGRLSSGDPRGGPQLVVPVPTPLGASIIATLTKAVSGAGMSHTLQVVYSQ